jgi:2,4-dienoyl-CoA reductase-like NADH-dependent reductase (Old Yellow Enzyme family)
MVLCVTSNAQCLGAIGPRLYCVPPIQCETSQREHSTRSRTGDGCSREVTLYPGLSPSEQAESIISEGKADTVALARALLGNPRWVWHAAERLGAEDSITYPPQYERSK